jgi:hypothetical protein
MSFPDRWELPEPLWSRLEKSTGIEGDSIFGQNGTRAASGHPRTIG